MNTLSGANCVSENPMAEIQAELELARAQTNDLARESVSENTRRLYESDWQGFLTWVNRAQQANAELSSLPASDETLALYIGHEIDTSPSTLARRLAAIRLMHRWSGFESPFDSAPSFAAVYTGYKRRWANRQAATAPQTAATESFVQTLADAWKEDSMMAKRNRALLLVGFDSALRRSELVEVDVEHMAAHPEGLEIYIPLSKSDQTGDGAVAYLLARPESSYCPVAALATWLDASGIQNGPTFRRLHRCGSELRLGTERLSDKAVYRLVKETTSRCGVVGRFGAHSLRRGLIVARYRSMQGIAIWQLHHGTTSAPKVLMRIQVRDCWSRTNQYT